MSKHKKYFIFIFLTAGLYFIRIFSKIISFNQDGFYAGHQNVWSDWALHTTLTNTFANKPISEWFLYHPYFSGGKLTYSFLTNAISGVLMKFGLSITQAMIWPSILFILLLLGGMYLLYFQILKSRLKATLGIFIFLTSAGPGFLKFIKDFYLNPNINTLVFPPIDYTRITEYQWLAGNIPTAMLVPQRAFLIGMMIGVWSLLLLITAIQNKQKKLFLAAGILAGILPIAHMHSFIAIVIISGFICLSVAYNFFLVPLRVKSSCRNKFKMFAFIKVISNILYFVIPATILSTTLFFTFVYGGIENPDFMKVSFGWTSKKSLLSWVKMWWDVWGIMIPVAVYSLKNLHTLENISKKTRKVTKYFYGFFAVFIISNIVIFQPTAWDNTKLFAWVYLGFSLLAAHIVLEFWKKKNHRIIAVIFMIMLSTTGILELIRLQRFDKNTYLLSKTQDIEFAKYVMKKTETDDIFLTSTDHNHPLQMWGSRSIVLGYKGWVPNFGFNIEERSNDIVNIFQNPTEYSYLLENYEVDYVVVGEQEKREFNLDQKYFNENFPTAFQNSTTVIYDVR